MCTGHRNAKKLCAGHSRTISSSRQKQLGNSEGESHIERVTLGGDEPPYRERARAKTTWTQRPASVQSSARAPLWPYPLRSQSKKDHFMYSSYVDTRLKGSGEWNYRGEQKITVQLENTSHGWVEKGCFLSTTFSERERKSWTTHSQFPPQSLQSSLGKIVHKFSYSVTLATWKFPPRYKYAKHGEQAFSLMQSRSGWKWEPACLLPWAG